MTSDGLHTALMAALVHADSVPKGYMPYDAQATAVLAVIADAMRGLPYEPEFTTLTFTGEHTTPAKVNRDDVLALLGGSDD